MSDREQNDGVISEINNDILVTTMVTIDRILKVDSKHKSDAIALYLFYSYTANWQGTKKPKATTLYVSNGLTISKDRVEKAKKILLDLGLIENITTFDEKGVINGHFIKVLYVKSHDDGKQQNDENTEKTHKNAHKSVYQGVDSPGGGKTDTNAYILVNKCLHTGKESLAASPPVQNQEDLQEKKPIADTDGKQERRDQGIFDVIESFRVLNPMIDRLFENITQRKAADIIFKKIGIEELQKKISLYAPRRNERFAPVITTPVQFADNYEKLNIFLSKDKSVSDLYNPKQTAGSYDQGIVTKSTNPFYKNK